MSTVCLIDGSSYLFRAYYAIAPLSNSKGFPTHAILGFTNMLLKVLSNLKPEYVSVVWDTPKKSFRAEMFEGYKADREACPEDLAVQIPKIRDIVEGLGFHQISMEGFEADDVIATLSNRYHDDHDIVIVSGDKDLTQLVNGRVIMWDTMRDKKFGPKEVEEKWGVPPSRMRDFLALTGDSSDSIPGVRGIGPKTALTLLQEYESLDGVLKSIPKMKEGRTRKLLEEGVENAKLSYELVGLVMNLKVPEKISDLTPATQNSEKLRHLLLDDLELKNLAIRLKVVPSSSGAGEGVASGTLSGAAGSSAALGETAATSVSASPGASSETPLATVTLLTRTASLLTLDSVTARDVFLQKAREHKNLTVYAILGPPKGWRPNLIGLFLGLGAELGWLPLGVVPSTEEVQFLKNIFEDPSIQKTSFDLKEMMRALGIFGVSLAGGESDVMLAAYLADSSGKMDLTSLTFRYLQAGFQHHELKEGELTADLELFGAERLSAIGHLKKILEEKLKNQNMLQLYREMEIPLSRVLAAMEVVGVRVNEKFLLDFQEELLREASACEEKIYHLAGMKFLIQSPKQLADVLFGKLSLPPQRKTKTGFSTDVDVLETLSKLHALPALILEYREIMKLKSTYVDALLELRDENNRVHTSFNQAVAVTGRLSSSDPNLQNIPIRTERGKRIREAFCAEPGASLVIADYSQIELRIMAHYSQDPRMMEAFAQGIDIHTKTAAEVFKVTVEEVTKEHRRIAKAINFGLIYGQTPFGLSQALGIPQSEAKQYIENYFKTYAKVKTCMEELIAKAREQGYAETLFGRRRWLPDLKSRNRGLLQFAERNAMNTPLQGTAADVIKKAMVVLDERLKTEEPEARLLLQVHDELMVECPKARAESVGKVMKRAMETTVQLSVPLEVSVDFGAHWGVKG